MTGYINIFPQIPYIFPHMLSNDLKRCTKMRNVIFIHFLKFTKCLTIFLTCYLIAKKTDKKVRNNILIYYLNLIKNTEIFTFFTFYILCFRYSTSQIFKYFSKNVSKQFININLKNNYSNCKTFKQNYIKFASKCQSYDID